MSKNNYAGWLTGCGIGCGAVLVVALAVLVGGYYFAKRAVEDIQDVVATIAKVEQEFGPVTSFTPGPDGRIPPERMEAFLAVRRETAPLRRDLDQQIADLEDRIAGLKEEQEGRFWGVFSAVRSGLGVIPGIAGFYAGRAEALLENRMGLGEYIYIYTLAYYSWLKKDPGDGPKFLRMADHHSVNWDPKNDPGEAYDARKSQVVREVRDSLTAMLRNSRRNLQDSGAGENRGWQRAVEAELLALDSRWGRIPWEDGLPAEIESSLKLFRDQLEDSYDPLMNPLEVLKFQHPDRH
jgi:hypothetical protein